MSRARGECTGVDNGRQRTAPGSGHRTSTATDGGRIVSRHGVAALLAAALALCGAGCWHQMPRDGRDAFVHSYLESIRDGTEFYRRYSLERDESVIGEVRPLLDGPFSIARWAGPVLEDECTVELSDGSHLLLHVIQREHAVEKVALYLYPSGAG